MAALVAGVLLGLGGPARATGSATPIEGTWRGTHLLQVSGSLESGFKISAAESWTISKVCTVSAGTLLEQYTPVGGSKYEVRWLNVWVPMNPDAPGAKCEFVFDGGPITVTVSAGATSLTIKDCGGDACGLTGTALKRVAPAPTTPKPTSTQTAPTSSATKLQVDLWEFPERYGQDENKDGLVDQFLTPERINPPERTALVWVHPAGGDCDPNASYSWRVDGQAAQLDPTRSKCVFSYSHFRGLRKHTIAVTATGADGVVHTGGGAIVLRDLLIYGIGDSVASGEGVPDVGAWGFNPTWVDYRCDRSHNSYQAWVAGWLAHANEKTSVTFVHLACSGAKITTGLLGKYGGLNDPGGPKLEPQVTQTRNLLYAGKRQLDALLLSVGANDLGFGQIIAFCIAKQNCWDQKGFDPKQPGKRLEQVVENRLHQLASRYRTLAAALRFAGVPANKVYITQYFDPTHRTAKKVCDPLLKIYDIFGAIPGVQTGTITWVEADRAYDELIVPMNNAVAKAARENRWHLVSGVQSAFETHGYCARDPWIVQLTESLWKQGAGRKAVPWIDAPIAEAGALHPNAMGHKAIALRTLDALKSTRPAINGLLPAP